MAKKGKLVNKKSFLELSVQWGIVLIFAVLPLLYFPGRIASYVTSKQYFFIGIIDVLVILWAWLLLVDRRYRLSRRNLLVLAPLFLFLCSMTISGLVGVDSATSFLSTVETGTGLILLYHAFIFACMIASFIRVQQKQLFKHIAQATLFSSAILAGMTFFTGDNGLFMTASKMLNGSTGGATMGNSLLAGAYFIFSIFFGLYLVTHELKLWKKIAYIAGIALVIFSPIYFNVAIFKGTAISSSYLFVGEARTAAFSLAVGLVCSFFIWLSIDKKRSISKIIGRVGLVAILLGGGFIIQQIASPASSVHSFFLKEAGNRDIDWKESIQGIKERPVLGWGPENFHVVYQKHLDPAVFNPERGNEVWSLHPHNNTLEVLINGGVIGLAFYLLLLAGLFLGIGKIYKKGQIDGKTFALLLGTLVAFIIQQQMIYDSITSYVIFFAIIGIVAGLSDTTNEPKSAVAYPGTAVYVVGTAVVLAMIPVWLYGSYLPARKMEEFQLIASMPSDQRPARYDHLFHSAGSYAVDTDAEFYTDPLLFAYESQRAALKNNPLYQKVASEELASLLSATIPVADQHPFDYHLRLSLIELANLQFYLTGDTSFFSMSDRYAAQAMALSPADPQIYFAYAQTLIGEKKIPEAKILLNKAISLNSHYTSAQSLLSALK